ncbi:hypothetical protein INT43_005545 [Umbelopsis isabellina]|uniref:Regulator of telomere elongation helicase 1 homolog n=1 Tax=Mortierella isabellina TaxID=91625 RepID=A0A8H7PNA9_MORIS|nr:hypothetical protein INT43_005545 [Umbelopsis isabellina]
MPEYILNGINVQFPYEAYDVQKSFMKCVIQALHDRSHALLESPTGTGKTLTLLCAALAWRRTFATRHEVENFDNQSVYQDEIEKIKLEQTISAFPENEDWKAEPPKIFYASRTHSQLSQVVKEIKNTKYRPKVCVLGSREQLCVNQAVKSASTNAARTALCRRKVLGKSCQYYNGLKKAKKILDDSQDTMDIEDTVKFGETHGACPFFLSRDSQAEADIVLLPYNYLVDATARMSQQIDLTNAIIIFDEAHNLESVCGEATSFELSTTTLRQCVNELNLCKNHVDEMDLEREEKLMTYDVIAERIDKLREAIEGTGLLAQGHMSKPGMFMYELLGTLDIDSRSIGYLQQGIDRAVEALASLSSSNVNTQKFSLSSLSQALRMLFRREYFSDTDVSVTMPHTKFYKVHIQQEQTETGLVERKISYWCFSPGLAMKELIDGQVRCVILASGTLSPLSSFASEMLLEFPIRLENSHVITAEQAFIGVVPKGPTGTTLNSTYAQRNRPEYKMELGNIIANFSKVVPEGLLVFFPSYSAMTDCIYAWKSTSQKSKSIWDRLNEQKQVFVEPKTKYEFNQALNGYYSKIKDPAFAGAIFLAVCRGKVSEGVDFADGRGRAVVITGIPFPNTHDPKIQQKKDFLDDIRFTSNRNETLSGSDWYKQQALRAVNQAIGRVIRHRKDYGAILLCDERFGSTEIINQLSAWLRNHVVLYKDFGQVQSNLTKFFKNMKQKHAFESPVAIAYEKPAATPDRTYARKALNVGSEEEGYGQITSRPQSFSDFSIISDSQPLTTISQSSEFATNVKTLPRATIEQAQKYSKQIESMGPAKHLQYKKLIRQYKKREIQIEPFIDCLIDIFIGENRLDLLHQFRIFLPSKHIQIFDRAIRAQEQIPDSSDSSQATNDVHTSKKPRID